MSIGYCSDCDTEYGHRGQYVVQGGDVDHLALIMSVLRWLEKLVPR